ncbi:hypothetical protein CLU96_1907 [Chryseobacterium sp. 52]|uniref:hypothetical protein n=1 Tax=Chryseobacterium sp. 52 TaxID=2035213 RepID=UPI000C179784|nr:hypothetical protein [Chryseobacterium sp. 52]PIF44909.1 hypothetical protein CLU96_1907 [Chryseobacterium sp. 52]
MQPKDFLKQVMTDTKVKLSEEFDKNFERKAFFDKKWADAKLKNNRGSLMVRSGMLRRSIRGPKMLTNSINWSSSQPQAKMLNEGGYVVVTEKMKRFFWAMYYKSSGGLTKIKSGELASNQRNQRLSGEAAQWKALALQKVGSRMKIEQRQFLGHHPQVDKFIKEIVDRNFRELNNDFSHNFLLYR